MVSMEKWKAKQLKLKNTYYTDVYSGGATVAKVLPAMRIWANSLGVRFDTWSSCTNNCHYCFARGLSRSMEKRNRISVSSRSARFGKVKTVERLFRRIFQEGKVNPYDWVDWAVSRRSIMEVGTLGEPMQPADQTFRATWNFLQLLKAYRYPLYLNTKGNLLIMDDSYYRALIGLPTVVVDLALVGMDDDDLSKMEPFAPPASARYALVKRLIKANVPVVISTRPILRGLTDKDWEGYVQWLVDAGVQSIHLRTLVVVGEMLKRKRWRDHVEQQGMQLFKGEYRYPKEYFVDLFQRALKVCEGTDTYVVGTRRYWFSLAGYHGKAAFDYMPKNVKESLVPWNIHNIFRTIKQDEQEPQLLLWENLGYPNPEKDGFLERIVIGSSHGCLLFNDCWTRNWRGRFTMTGEDFLRLSLWDGFNPRRPGPSGEITRTHRIWKVYDEKSETFPKSAGGGGLLVYLPPTLEKDFVKNQKGLPPYVPLEAAEGLPQPVRKSLNVPSVN